MKEEGEEIPTFRLKDLLSTAYDDGKRIEERKVKMIIIVSERIVSSFSLQFHGNEDIFLRELT
jgi:hypothetical protein